MEYVMSLVIEIGARFSVSSSELPYDDKSNLYPQYFKLFGSRLKLLHRSQKPFLTIITELLYACVCVCVN